MNKEQFNLYKEYKTAEFEYKSEASEKFTINDYDALLKLAKLRDEYNALKAQVEEQNIVLDKKYSPQFWNSDNFEHDKRDFTVGDEIFINVPEDAGEWCDMHMEHFLKEGIVTEVLPDEEFGGFDLMIRFKDEDKDEFLPSNMVNKK